ncbi:VanW family protein [Pedococcus ginsenosidimutans]|uniref:VanW family protein n=1 Tax=Pedococcus ginsenosidimutans TaxID=490570 RepID=A0ABP8Y6F7_9MICO
MGVGVKEGGSAGLRLGVAVAVLLAGYLGLAWFLGRHVPANTSVSGVPIGGMAPASAERTLERALASKEKAKVTLTAGDRSVDLDPAAAGLELDFPATVDGLSGFSLKPADLWDRLTGGHEEQLKTSVDRQRLEAAVTGVRSRLETQVVQGGITFPSGKVSVTRPVVGAKLSVPGTADEIAARWPARGAVAAKVDTVEPALTADEVDRAVKEFATPAMSAPVTVAVGAKRFTVKPAAYAPALSMKPDADGRLAPAVDTTKLVAAVHAAAGAAGVETKARDAKIMFRGTKPTVAPAATGVALDDKSIAATFVPALTSASRTATVATTVVLPKLTTAQAVKIMPKEVISTFTTNLPFNPPRTENIQIAARTLNGTYVGPGEQFSLNKVLGQRTAAKGYNEAPVIVNGRLTKDYGGGISQLSTTTFNAAFFSGVRIDQYLPHSFYISRYPEGREATISWPDVDQKWTNDTGYGILIQAVATDKTVTVTFHGTKVWDIQAVKGPRRNVIEPKRIVDDKKGCVPQTPTPGFDVTVSRIFKKAGKVIKTSQFSTHYIPEDDVVCTNP